MGAALKKGVDYAQLGMLKWAAWGVIDIEKLERMQRRNYINHVREELKLHGLQLECGGSATWPYYRIYKMTTVGASNAPAQPDKIEWTTTSANVRDGAFKKVCLDALAKIAPDAVVPLVQSEDDHK